MIILRRYRAFENKFLCDPQILVKWKNTHNFGFDITNPYEWRKFLRRLRINGVPLPVRTEYGNPFVYQVYVWGSIKGIKMKGGFLELFPGRDALGRQLNKAVFGRIDLNLKLK